MYTNTNAHRFPALALAATLTLSVVVGLSSLADMRPGTVSPDSRLVKAGISARVVSQASGAPSLGDVIATRT